MANRRLLPAAVTVSAAQCFRCSLLIITTQANIALPTLQIWTVNYNRVVNCSKSVRSSSGAQRQEKSSMELFFHEAKLGSS